MPSREELLQSIQPGMRLNKNFFLRIYGYEISYPGFAIVALDKLEAAGCSKAREYYLKFTSEYEARQKAEIKEAAAWYAAELEKKRNHEKKQKEGEERRKQQIADRLEKMNDGELLKLWQQKKQQIPEVS